MNVELGGLARTDNSGWGDEFERLTERLLVGLSGADGPKSGPENGETETAATRSSQVNVP